jgi:hypothetical protein
MDSRNSRNALIACGVFFSLLFVMMAMHSYEEAAKAYKPESSSKDAYHQNLVFKKAGTVNESDSNTKTTLFANHFSKAV